MNVLSVVVMVGGLLILPLGLSAEALSEQGPAPTAPSATAANGRIDLTLQVPLFSDRFSKTPVAAVNDEVIMLEDLVANLASMHGARQDGGMSGRTDFSHALRRLINTRLLVLEARTMGLNELEGVEDFLQGRADSTMRMQLQKQVADKVQADEREVEKRYRDMIREYRLRSLLFKDEKDAKALVKAAAEGGAYETLAAEAVASGKARGQAKAEALRGPDLLPEVRKAADALQAGGMSKPIKIKTGYVVLRLETVQDVESLATRDEARRQVLAAARGAALVKYNRELSKKYLKVDDRLVDRLVFDPGKMQALLEDKRVIARVKGEAPVTVGDLAMVIEEKLYHGSGTSTKEKITRRKLDALEEVLAKRVLLAEAKRLGIDRTDEHRSIMKEQETSLLFGLFVERVVKPEVKLKHEEVQAYYEQHRHEYLAASRIRLDGTAFMSADNAASALASIQRGTDPAWVRENAPGLVPADAKGRYEFPDGYVLASELPPPFRTAIEGARSGEMRVASGDGPFAYLLTVLDVREPEPLPLEKVKEEIEQKVYQEKIETAVDAWADKLRPSYDVQVYLREEGQASPAEPATSTMVRKSDGLH